MVLIHDEGFISSAIIKKMDNLGLLDHATRGVLMEITEMMKPMFIKYLTFFCSARYEHGIKDVVP